MSLDIDNFEKFAAMLSLRRARSKPAIAAAPKGFSRCAEQVLVPYFGSGMGNGNAHDRNNPPVLLMGGANGRLKGDRHIVVEDKQPTANLLLGMAELANAEVEQIGHSTGRLSL
ncbi:MAG TPA: hypothetical protein VNZ24_06300 [Vicinamibacterales bacterium]|nr:hypothetical protein [Vicinamibacterales bacterium]